MAYADDLDMAIDGYQPEESYFTPNRRRAARQMAQAQPAIVQPAYDKQEQEAEAQPQPQPRPQNTQNSQQPSPKKARQNKAQQEQPQAKPKKRSSEGRASQLGIVKFLTDKRLHYFLGLMLLLSCVFMLFAIVSYFKHGAHDQSVVMNSTLDEIAQAPGSVKNSAGGFGAWLSHAMLCNALGLGSVVFIVYAWILGISLLGYRKCNFWSITFKTLLVSITISIVLGLVTYNTPTVMRWGGTHGHYANAFIMSYANWIGAVLVSLLLIIAVICVYYDELYSAWRRWRIAAYRRKMQLELQRQRSQKVQNMPDVVEQSEPQPAADQQPDGEERAEAAPITIDVADAKAIDDEPVSPVQPVVPAEAVMTQRPNPLDDLLESDDIEIDMRPAAPVQPAQVAAQPAEAAVLPQPAPVAVQPAPVAVQPAAVVVQPAESSAAEPVVAAIDTPATPAPGVLPDENFTIKTTEIEQSDIFVDIDEGGAKAAASPTAYEPYDHRAELPKYRFPDIDLLAERKSGPIIDMEEQQANKDRIVKTLADYNIPISRIEATVGPTVTLYEIVPAEGVRISQIKRLEDDIALSLAALGIRIIAPIPGKGTVGIEVPNSDPQTVSMRAVITSKKYQECKMALPMAMGATISNDIFIADLAKMPHMLVAGATGMGKSVGLNAIIASLLYKKHPSELKFVLIDPKMVEFSLYGKLERHYLAMLPDQDDAIITDPNKVIQTLNSLCVEMDDRYALLRKANVRSLEEYNKKFTDRKLNPNDGHKYLPYIVVVVDEFADLIMTAGKEVETPIARIAQKARAVGMHMIIATQRPSTNVITGIIKANFPGRIAFRVIQMVDSKTILDTTGANQLIGRGDMLFSHNGSMERVQCAFISTEEVEDITEWIGNQVGFEHPYFLPEYQPEGAVDAAAAGPGDRDALFAEAARFIVQRQAGSGSILQRQFNIGYNRAGRLMDQLEAAGIVGPVNGAKPRAILVDAMSLETILNQFG